LDIYKPHEFTLPMSQESSQSEVPTSGYGRITDDCTSWKFPDNKQAEVKQP
jgi:hypothetical protein